MIKFNAKNRFYKHHQKGRGLYENVTVTPSKATVDTDNKRLTVSFNMCAHSGKNSEVIGSGELVFTDTHVPTTIAGADGNPVEIITHLTSGGVYDESKIIDWGYPSFARVQGYFDKESVWTGLSFADSPFIQLAIDWLKHTLQIDGVKVLLTNFDYTQE